MPTSSMSRRDRGVRRVAGQPRTQDAILDDVEGVDHRGGDIRRVARLTIEIAWQEAIDEGGVGLLSERTGLRGAMLRRRDRRG